jgi:hypothetical protein
MPLAERFPFSVETGLLADDTSAGGAVGAGGLSNVPGRVYLH